MINRLVKVMPKGEMGEGLGKAVHSLVESGSECDVRDSER